MKLMEMLLVSLLAISASCDQSEKDFDQSDAEACRMVKQKGTKECSVSVDETYTIGIDPSSKQANMTAIFQCDADEHTDSTGHGYAYEYVNFDIDRSTGTEVEEAQGRCTFSAKLTSSSSQHDDAEPVKRNHNVPYQVNGPCALKNLHELAKESKEKLEVRYEFAPVDESCDGSIEVDNPHVMYKSPDCKERKDYFCGKEEGKAKSVKMVDGSLVFELLGCNSKDQSEEGVHTLTLTPKEKYGEGEECFVLFGVSELVGTFGGENFKKQFDSGNAQFQKQCSQLDGVKLEELDEMQLGYTTCGGAIYFSG